MCKAALIPFALMLGMGPVWASEIRCTAAGESPVEIALKARSFGGREMSCIAGSFVSHLTPCAPDRAFSLSAPTASADVVGIVDRWQDYADHDGGVVGFFKTHTTISFSGGFNRRGRGFDPDWSFSVDRRGRSGLLSRPGKPIRRFSCGGAL